VPRLGECRAARSTELGGKASRNLRRHAVDRVNSHQGLWTGGCFPSSAYEFIADHAALQVGGLGGSEEQLAPHEDVEPGVRACQPLRQF